MVNFIKENGAYIQLLKKNSKLLKLVVVCFHNNYMILTYEDVPVGFKIDNNLLGFIRFEKEKISSKIDLNEYPQDSPKAKYNRVGVYYCSTYKIISNFLIFDNFKEKYLTIQLNRSIFNGILLDIFEDGIQKYNSFFSMKYYSFI
jgi:hypothetical protein